MFKKRLYISQMPVCFVCSFIVFILKEHHFLIIDLSCDGKFGNSLEVKCAKVPVIFYRVLYLHFIVKYNTASLN